MLYYISGKITDVSREKELENKQMFYQAENDLVARGFEVFNPAKLDELGRSWEWYLARDLKWIYENKPALYMLPGWQESRGARLERQLALLLHLPIVEPV